ncbi:MAG: carbohydrate ABC transporter permease [Anaerolineae bacterium]|nr:carbohydrate ABC transporter permease [Anaerolineae bacterium]
MAASTPEALADIRRQQAQRLRQAAIRRLLARIIFIALLIGCTIMFMAPFVWLISASLKVRAEVFNNELIPDPIAWENYVNVWQAAPVLSWLKNSVVVGFLAAATVTVSCAAIAFGFSYFRFPGRDTLFGLVLATMMLPGAVTMVPVFLVWNGLGLVNTQVPLWAGNLFGSAFYIFMIRQFYLSLPRELFEAARVDGANYLQIWRHIALPLTRTALIVVFIFEFKASWTDLIKPLIYLYNTALFTLPRGLKAILDQFGQGGEMQWEIVLAASVIVTIPMILIFFLGQRYFMEGIATSGLKG